MVRADAAGSTSALRFLLPAADGSPSRPTRAWIVQRSGVKLEDWELRLEPQPAPAEEVDDLKHWALFQSTEHRFLDPGGKGKAESLRRYSRSTVVTEYLRTLVAELPPDVSATPVERMWLLMPAIADAKRRTEYRDAIEAALPGAKMLHEPEMVLEYFRLVRRELRLEKGKSSVFLVVDAGAATTNLTFVLTRKDKVVVDAATTRDRSVLRAQPGNAPDMAGAWVDREVAKQLGWSAELRALPPVRRNAVLREIERAKVETATSGRPTTVRIGDGPPASVTVTILEEVAAQLWAHLRPTYLELARKLLADIQRGTRGEYFRDALGAAEVKGPDEVHRLIDGIVLAGGTSRLPGFEQALLDQIFGGSSGVDLYTVGDDYAIAASMGATAHVLDSRYEPSRLHAREGVDAADSLAFLPYLTTPLSDVYWTWKPPNGSDVHVPVFDAHGDLAQTGGEQPVNDVPALPVNTVFESCLSPGEKADRAGVKRYQLAVKDVPVTANVRFDPETMVVEVTSPELRNVRTLRYDLSFRQKERVARTMRREPSARLWSDGAPDIIIDLGMSKTVVLMAGEGPFVSPFAPRPDEDMAPTVLPPPPPPPPPPAPSVLPVAPPPQVAAETTAPVVRPPVLRPPSPDPPAVDPPGPLVVASPRSGADGDPPPVAGHTTPAVAPPLADDGGGSAGGATAGDALSQRPPPDLFGRQLTAALQPLVDAGLGGTAADLTLLSLALAVRPFVLLSGPPGSGKSTLVRLAAQLLRLTPDRAFHEVTVQSHWRSEAQVPVAVRRSWEAVGRGTRLYLFDEVNLTRPENYLMAFLRLLEVQGPGGGILGCGTLNIDDASRPPSPKIIDRAFFIEIEAPRDARVPQDPLRLLGSRGVDGLPLAVPVDDRALSPRVSDIVGVMQAEGDRANLRGDLRPTLRDLIDLSHLASLHAKSEVEELLPKDDLDDHMIAGRLLTKLAGAAEQVEPLVKALEAAIAPHAALRRCKRRLAVARAQMRLGFVSPWQ